MVQTFPLQIFDAVGLSTAAASLSQYCCALQAGDWLTGHSDAVLLPAFSGSDDAAVPEPEHVSLGQVCACRLPEHVQEQCRHQPRPNTCMLHACFLILPSSNSAHPKHMKCWHGGRPKVNGLDLVLQSHASASCARQHRCHASNVCACLPEQVSAFSSCCIHSHATNAKDHTMPAGGPVAACPYTCLMQP